MSKDILYFESAGSDTDYSNDMKNCRVRTAFINDENKIVYLELLARYNRTIEEYGKNGCKLKSPKVIQYNGMLCCDFCYYVTIDGDDCNENKLPCMSQFNMMIPYTKENVLKFVNENCHCGFKQIEILPWLSGYYVHDNKNKKDKSFENSYGKYNLMDNFVNVPARTAERNRIYNEVAKEYFESIYKKHLEYNPRNAHLMSKYHTWSILSMDDKTMTLRSHTYKELIDDNERVKVFEVIY